VGPGMHCLDLGCGAGDVTLELAGRVAPGGTVVGIDMDEEQLAVARERAASAGLRNVSFRPSDVYDWSNPQGYDVAYCRNVLQHLSHPVRVLKEMWAAVRPAGVLVVEDGDFDGCFAYPPNDGHAFWVDRYQQLLQRRGGDPLSGRKLAQLFAAAGIPAPQLNVVQRVEVSGEAKTLPLLALDATAETMIAESVATRAEIDHAASELAALVADPSSVCGSPRLFQAFSRKP